MPPVIDCHAHMVPPDMWRAMLADGARYGVEIGGTDERRMIRLAGSSYARPMYMPLTLGTKFAELQNDTIAGVVAANPDRYAGAANVPLQDAATAVKVMERAR